MLTAVFGLVCAATHAAMANECNPPRVSYVVSLPAPQTQTAEISYTIRNPGGASNSGMIDVHLPAWRPGKYLIIDPAGTIRSVAARNSAGGTVPIEKIEKATWRVTHGNADAVTVSYVLYANSLADRTRHIDDSHAFLSGSAVFMYAEEFRGEPLTVRLDGPKEWRIACGLDASPQDERTLTAPDYDTLADSPLEIGRHDLLTTEVDGTPIEIAIWGTKANYKADALTRDFAAIVRVQRDIFGSLPYQRYVFITHIAPGIGGGIEHLNSTVIHAKPNQFDTPAMKRSFMSLVSHEHFHTWNVKQFRPRGLSPYNYRKENYTPLLWVAEGTTSYYDTLCTVRAGVLKPKEYLSQLAGTIKGELLRPGAALQSLEASSFDSWIKFNKATPDSVNATVNFYSKGEVVSFMLDMELRHRTGNASTLDTVMRMMYERFPLKGPGYTTEDLLSILREAGGGEFGEFFDAYVRGTGQLDVESALSRAGLRLTKGKSHTASIGQTGQTESEPDARNGKDEASDEDEEPNAMAYIGLTVKDADGVAVVTAVLSDGPAYQAGIIADDQIVALNGRKLRASELDGVLRRLGPDAEVRLSFFRRDELRNVTFKAASRGVGEWKIEQVKKPTEFQRSVYESWLGVKWEEKKTPKADAEPRGAVVAE